MAGPGIPVIIKASGGIPVRQVTSGGAPATVASKNGIAITLTANRGIPLVISGGTPTPTPFLGGRVSMVGDSFGANASTAFSDRYTTYQSGVPVWLEALSLGNVQFDPTLNKGVSGRTSAQVLSNFDAEVNPDTARIDFGLVDVGRNDIGGVSTAPVMTATQSSDNIKAICAKYNTLGKPCILMLPNPPRADSQLHSNGTIRAAQRQMMADVNNAIRSWVLTQLNVYLVDYESIWDNGSGAPKTNYSYDGLHPSRVGAYYSTKLLWDTYSAKFPARTAPIYTNYNSSTNPFGNLISILGSTVPTMAGTTGQKFNAQGNLATGYVFGRLFGSNVDADIQLTKEPGTDDKQIITFNPAGMSGDFTGQCVGTGNTFGGRPTTPAELVGKWIAAEFTMEVTGSLTFGLPTLQMVARNNSVSVQSEGASHLDGLANNVFSLPNGTYLLRSPPVLVAAVNVTPTFWSDPIMIALTGAKGNVKLSKPWIGRVT